MLKSFKNHHLDLISFSLLTLLLPFFFYKLGQSSLVSWDEAWYAEIARNILQTGNLFTLFWNQMGYYDHPPVGFWLIALGESVFGYSEFGVRFASASVGFLTLIATYFLGKELFNRTVGFCSAIALSSSFWFLYRARSGNLDVFLTFFFVLTFYTAYKASTNKKFLIPFAISFTLLILTKTGIPFTIIPALIIIFWKTRYKIKDLFAPLLVFLIIFSTWFVSQILSNMSFLQRYLMIGLPGIKAQTSYLENFQLAKTYLHDGIGKWFWPGVFGVSGSLVVFQRKFFILPVFCLSFFAPFVFSPKGHIWHLIPLYPFMILSFFAFAYWLLSVIPSLFRNLPDKWTHQPWKILNQVQDDKFINLMASLILFVFTIYISSIQLKSAWVQFIDTTKYKSDEQILSEEAGKYNQPFFIDDDFGPTAVWYSGKQVMQIRDDDLKRLFEGRGQFIDVKGFVLITKKYRLDEQQISTGSYQILKSDRDKILVIRE